MKIGQISRLTLEKVSHAYTSFLHVTMLNCNPIGDAEAVESKGQVPLKQ